MELVIGDKVWSSWSMRPWLVLKRTGAPFTETLVPLRHANTPQLLRQASPSGLVPVLKDGGLTVWDSLAISEYLAEKFPEAKLWPEDQSARAIARCAAAEMHAGFASLRGECSMDLSLQKVATLSEATQENIRRIVHLWTQLRQTYGQGGAFLFGQWSIADAFYTPVATRFRSYGVRLSDYGDMGAAGTYAEALLETPEFMEWEKAAMADRAA
jgi:glutathione S-transferase